jgi:Fe-S-cluster-containing dehydrogenase component
MCLERLEKGQEPACVEACPTGTLKLVSLKEVIKTRRREASKQLVKETQAKEKTKSRKNHK